MGEKVKSLEDEKEDHLERREGLWSAGQEIRVTQEAAGNLLLLQKLDWVILYY